MGTIESKETGLPIPFTLTRDEIDGRSTALIKKISIRPKNAAPGDFISIRILLSNLGPVAMPWGLSFDVIHPTGFSASTTEVESQKNIARCSHGDFSGSGSTSFCTTENLGPQKSTAEITLRTQIPENFSNKRYRVKVKAYSDNVFQKVKKDTFRRAIKIKRSSLAACQVNPKFECERCDIDGGSGLDFAFSCLLLEPSERTFILIHHGKITDQNDPELKNRIDKYTIACFSKTNLCRTLKKFGSNGHVVATPDSALLCNTVRQRCANSNEVSFCDSV